MITFDVRNSPEERNLVNFIIRQNNRQKGSKYLREKVSLLGYSYNNSYKNSANKWPFYNY